MKLSVIATPLLFFSTLWTIQAQQQPRPDLTVVHRIKAEAAKRGDVVRHLEALTDQYGPRLTASPEFDRAAGWALGRLREWGLSNPHLEKWGPFGRSWSLRQFTARMTEPQYSTLIGFPLAWSSSTKGLVTAEPVLIPVRTLGIKDLQSDVERIEKQYAGKLRGKAVLMTSMRASSLQLKAPAQRYTDAELMQQAVAPETRVSKEFDYSKLALPEDPNDRIEFLRNAPPGFSAAYRNRGIELRRRLHDFFRKEGVTGIFVSDARGDGGTVFGESAGWYEAKYPSPLPVIAITAEHYNRIGRLLERKVPVKVEFEIRADISDRDVEPSNIVAEIPGGSKADELIMVGAHFDSWIGGTGATDNASGSAVALEAMRILKTLNLKLDRTVRLVLWSGEEEGLLGSKAYVKEHFGDFETMKLTPNQEKVSAYFNLDNGSGRIRGVYLQDNDAARPYFDSWLAPFRDQGVTTISIRNTGGTDHLSFDAVGIPGFQFIQDPLEYGSRTHHSNMDVFDHTQGPDLIQASAVMASVIYNAANMPEKMPRKPLPEPKPKWTPAPESNMPNASGGGQH